jgi:predicted RNA binding protein YcfA (HicA-like mRNA interferase family)
MSQYDKLVEKIRTRKDIGFDEAVKLLKNWGYHERVTGSHHSFSKLNKLTITIKRQNPIHPRAIKDLWEVAKAEGIL